MPSFNLSIICNRLLKQLFTTDKIEALPELTLNIDKDITPNISVSCYVQSLYEIGKITTELHELGIELKDYTRGLIDFPSMRENRIVLLCWQLGEGDKIEFWHEIEGGFEGRQPL